MATPVEGTGNVDPSGSVQGDPSNNTPGPNPAWNDALSVIPEQFHAAVTPHFQKWDQAANSRIESLNAQYEPYKAYIDHGITPDVISQGLGILQVLEENPQAVYDALAAQLGVNTPQTPETAPQTPTGENNENVVLPPGWDRLNQGVEAMAQHLLMAEQQKAEAAASAQLEADLKRVEEKYGSFNPDLFLPYLSSAIDKNMTIDKAAESYFAALDGHNKQVQAAQPYAPTILGANSGGGAGLPSNNIDVAKLSDAERKNLVVEMLRRNASNG